MFGNILIDKLRFSKKVNLIQTPYQVKNTLDEILRHHFIDNAFSVEYDRQYLRVEFTPTRYIDEISEDSNKKPNLNLEMIEEEKLLALLREIYQVLGECNATWIDLTKNIIVEEPVKKYIEALYKRKFKHPYKVNDVNSDINNATLVLNPLKNKKKPMSVDCRNLNRQITFYDKTRELEKKARVPFIDNVWLTNEEIAQIPTANYIREIGRLYLNNINGLNILRCEQRYKYTSHIKRITGFLLGSKEQEKLNLSTMIDLLDKGELYSKLDDFYTSELRNYVFIDNIQKIKPTKNKFILIIKDIIEKHDEADLMIFQPLFEELGENCKNAFNRSMDTIQQQTQGVYYNELYKKFNI